MYDPMDGHVTVDGHDLRYLDPAWLRSELLGVVPQGGSLLSGTIAENVSLASPLVSREDVDLALSKAGCDPFLASLELGMRLEYEKNESP